MRYGLPLPLNTQRTNPLHQILNRTCRDGITSDLYQSGWRTSRSQVSLKNTVGQGEKSIVCPLTSNERRRPRKPKCRATQSQVLEIITDQTIMLNRTILSSMCIHRTFPTFSGLLPFTLGARENHHRRSRRRNRGRRHTIRPWSRRTRNKPTWERRGKGRLRLQDLGRRREELLLALRLRMSPLYPFLLLAFIPRGIQTRSRRGRRRNLLLVLHVLLHRKLLLLLEKMRAPGLTLRHELRRKRRHVSRRTRLTRGLLQRPIRQRAHRNERRHRQQHYSPALEQHRLLIAGTLPLAGTHLLRPGGRRRRPGRTRRAHARRRRGALRAHPRTLRRSLWRVHHPPLQR